MSNLNNNTTQLESLLVKINALPDADSGGGSVETCTVTVSMSGLGATFFVTAYENGQTCGKSQNVASNRSVVLENVVRGSYIVCTGSTALNLSGGLLYVSTNGDVVNHGGNGYDTALYFTVNSDATINIMYD